MKYLENRNGWYVYNRRVPNSLKNFDNRTRIRIALNTQCQNTALKRFGVLNQEIEQYWKGLVEANENHSKEKFKSLVSLSRRLGFTYMSTTKVLERKLEEILERLLTVKKYSYDETITKALLGDKEVPFISLSQALNKFWQYSKPTLIRKNDDQQRKWKNPRIKAVNNFIKVVGDIDILEITNADLLKLRDWWLLRVEKENIKYSTINKDFTHLKGIIETVSDHLGLGIDIQSLFKKIQLKEYEKQTRKSYTTEFIKQEILKPETVDLLDKETKALLHICVETGARPIEIVNLNEDDIFLDSPIPYIYIRPRKGYSLKTIESKRKLPILGQALIAFQQFPKGFNKYKSNSDMVSSKINSFLDEKNLRPTEKHSLYSFRHSFQDRLNKLELPDRIQCQLMGHKFRRPKYGSGADLDHLQQIMQKVSLTL
jgi:integrase